MSQIQFLDWLDFYGKLRLSQQLQMSQDRRWPALKRVVYAAYSMRSIQEWCHCESKLIPVLHIVNVTKTVQHSLHYAHDVIAQIAEDQKDQFFGTSRLFMNSMRHMVIDWNDRQLRRMPHFPHHAHVDEMTNAEQQWGVATTPWVPKWHTAIFCWMTKSNR